MSGESNDRGFDPSAMEPDELLQLLSRVVSDVLGAAKREVENFDYLVVLRHRGASAVVVGGSGDVEVAMELSWYAATGYGKKLAGESDSN